MQWTTLLTCLPTKMAATNPSSGNHSPVNIVDIVRRVVTTMNNLDSNTNTRSSINNVPVVQSVNNTGPRTQSTQSCDEEVNNAFRLPRNQPAQRQNGPVRSKNGRFAPYKNRGKKANDSKKASQANWIMKDVCLLPRPDWDTVPRRESKQQLVRQNMFVDAWTLDKTWSEKQLRNEVLTLFKEQLTAVQDFEFVKAVGNTLSKVRLPENQELNGRTIKHVAGNGPIYIRALRNIQNLEAENEWDSLSNEDSPPECTNRRSGDIREYIEATSSMDLAIGDDEDANKASCSSVSSQFDFEIDQLKELFPCCSPDILVEAREKCCDFEDAVDFVMHQSNKSTEGSDSNKSDEPSMVMEKCSLAELLKRAFPHSAVAPKRIVINRGSILSDSIALFKQRDFDFSSPVKITFEGEPAIDGGGPKREYFTLLLRELLSASSAIHLFEGKDGKYLPLHNSDALRSKLYLVAGRMVATSIINGGPGFPHFPQAVWQYIMCQDTDTVTEHLTKDDVVDYEIIEAINKLDCVTSETLDQVAEDVKPLLIEAGFPKRLSMDNFFQAIMSLCLHSVLLSRKAELDQFISGLGPLHAVITKYPTKAECLFVTGNEKPPTADELLSLMVFEGVQPNIVNFFNEYLKTSQDGTLSDLLMFATGCSSIPPAGFCQPSVITVLQNDSKYPNTNTCPLELELPGHASTFLEFKKSMDSTLEMQKVGFGII